MRRWQHTKDGMWPKEPNTYLSRIKFIKSQRGESSPFHPTLSSSAKTLPTPIFFPSARSVPQLAFCRRRQTFILTLPPRHLGPAVKGGDTNNLHHRCYYDLTIFAEGVLVQGPHLIVSLELLIVRRLVNARGPAARIGPQAEGLIPLHGPLRRARDGLAPRDSPFGRLPRE